ncbi:MAG: hypothetical protein KBD01_05750 [Acidobacteria bacterium]|nr:hypothetical protein [Acidobacteriota bacterium]
MPPVVSRAPGRQVPAHECAVPSCRRAASMSSVPAAVNASATQSAARIVCVVLAIDTWASAGMA